LSKSEVYLGSGKDYAKNTQIAESRRAKTGAEPRVTRGRVAGQHAWPSMSNITET
jgi:hypothetical protein